MALAKRGTGHCLMLFCVLLLLATSGCTARDTIAIGGGGGSKGPKKPAHAQPPPPPDQGSHPAITAQKQPQGLAAAVTTQSRSSADAAVKGQLSGGSSSQDQQHASSGANMLAQQQAEQQLQQGADTQVLSSGAGRSVREPGRDVGARQDEHLPNAGAMSAKGAARNDHQQPKALHDEQFPGNGAQGDHEKPSKQLEAAKVQAQQPKGLEDAAHQPEKQRQASSFEVIGGQSAQDADQLSATLQRLEGFKGATEASVQDREASALLEEIEEDVARVEEAKIKPMSGWQGLLKAVKERWNLHQTQIQRAREREARRQERQYLLTLRAKAKGERAARRAAREQLLSAKAESETKANEAAEAAKQKAEDSKKQEKETKEGNTLYNKGSEMLDAAVTMEANVKGAMLSEFFRAVRTEGRAGNGTFRRGILIPSGGTTLINHAYATISVLRNTLNCTLPVELVFNGEYEMDKGTCDKFETDFKDVKCIDASKFDAYPSHHRPVSLKKEEENAKGAKADTEGNKDTSGFQFKVFALCYITSFDEVLMLDADNLPLRNPEVLFNSPEYRRSGTLFFSDWWDMVEWVKPQAYTAFGLPYPGDEKAILATESGQILMNRNLHADALEWLWFVNSHSEVVYKLMYGDKDTFRLAFALAGKSDFYEQVSIPPSCPLDASVTNAEPVTYLHAGMIQHDPSGIPTFLHRTAEGKVYPFNNGYRKAHYVTVPLSSRRAAGVLGHDFKKMGLRSDQIDHATYGSCAHPFPQTFHAACGVSLKSGTYPVPVIPVADIVDLAPVMDASYAVHDELQHAFHTTFVMG